MVKNKIAIRDFLYGKYLHDTKRISDFLIKDVFHFFEVEHFLIFGVNIERNRRVKNFINSIFPNEIFLIDVRI